MCYTLARGLTRRIMKMSRIADLWTWRLCVPTYFIGVEKHVKFHTQMSQNKFQWILDSTCNLSYDGFVKHCPDVLDYFRKFYFDEWKHCSPLTISSDMFELRLMLTTQSRTSVSYTYRVDWDYRFVQNTVIILLPAATFFPPFCPQSAHSSSDWFSQHLPHLLSIF